MLDTDTDRLLHDLNQAFPPRSNAPKSDTRDALIARLQTHFHAYLSPPENFRSIPDLASDPDIVAIANRWVEWEDEQVDVADLPTSGADFRDWFMGISSRHEQEEFCHFLRHEATARQIAVFVLAEELVDSRFDDLVAIAQLGADELSKLTLAENYWDEMGQGSLEGMHSRLFEASARPMSRLLTQEEIDTLRTHEVIENATIVLLYGLMRRFAPRGLAALGLMETTAPARFAAMVDGGRRVGLPEEVITYQQVHIHIDENHGAEWLENVLVPLASRSADMCREIALGALTRERIANAYYTRVLAQMKALQ